MPTVFLWLFATSKFVCDWLAFPRSVTEPIGLNKLL
jgi:hypothetical protein